MNHHTLPKWYWVVAALALVWNLLGVAAFAAQMVMDLSTLPEAQRPFFETRPTWAVAGFGVAVFAGALGSIALLIRKTWAIALFIISLLGLLAQTTHAFALSDAMEIFGPSGLVMPAVTFAISIALIWFALAAKNKDWLR